MEESKLARNGKTTRLQCIGNAWDYFWFKRREKSKAMHILNSSDDWFIVGVSVSRNGDIKVKSATQVDPSNMHPFASVINHCIERTLLNEKAKV